MYSTARLKILQVQSQEHESFFRYSSGRWIWDEEQQLRSRYKAFNVDELRKVAARSIGSDSCISMVKLTEGGYNKVFRLLMNDGKAAIMRIPNPNAGLFFTPLLLRWPPWNL
jgi:hypothetical protein